MSFQPFMITLKSNPERMKNFQDNKIKLDRLKLWPAVDTVGQEKFTKIEKNMLGGLGLICPKYLDKIKRDRTSVN